MSERFAESGGVRQTLADHFVMWHQMGGPDEPPYEWRCACGLKFGFSDSAIDHVAEQVQAALRHDEAEKGRLWQHLRDRCERAEAMHAEAFHIGIAKQERIEAVQRYADRCAAMRTEPSTEGLRRALSTPPGSGAGS